MQRYEMSLHDYLKRSHPTKAQEPNHEYIIRKCLRDAASGINHMHTKDILHRDIKSANILLLFHDNDVDGKVSDLGLSSDIDTQPNCLEGTPKYWAPEIILSKKLHRPYEYTYYTDIWAFGVIPLEIAVYPEKPEYLADMIEIKKVDRRELRTLTWEQFHEVLKNKKPKGEDRTLKAAIFSTFNNYSNFMENPICPSIEQLENFSWEMQLCIVAAACMRKNPMFRLPFSHFISLQDPRLEQLRAGKQKSA
ncbi:hypothetical protein GCM10023116_23360 [Kistimonas scapharcae]|uniref:Protein kinase domain-containing protein n=2 Tax=Kistimonas scapharcae TaxID=1036133 RepID=A0ABP8V1F4_9GAMM